MHHKVSECLSLNDVLKFNIYLCPLSMRNHATSERIDLSKRLTQLISSTNLLQRSLNFSKLIGSKIPNTEDLPGDKCFCAPVEIEECFAVELHTHMRGANMKQALEVIMARHLIVVLNHSPEDDDRSLQLQVCEFA